MEASFAVLCSFQVGGLAKRKGSTAQQDSSVSVSTPSYGAMGLAVWQDTSPQKALQFMDQGLALVTVRIR